MPKFAVGWAEALWSLVDLRSLMNTEIRRMQLAWQTIEADGHASVGGRVA